MAADNSIPAFKMWRLINLSLAKSDLPNTTPIRQISWTRDGAYVAVAAGDHTVRLGSNQVPGLLAESRSAGDRNRV